MVMAGQGSPTTQVPRRFEFKNPDTLPVKRAAEEDWGKLPQSQNIQFTRLATRMPLPRNRQIKLSGTAKRGSPETRASAWNPAEPRRAEFNLIVALSLTFVQLSFEKFTFSIGKESSTDFEAFLGRLRYGGLYPLHGEQGSAKTVLSKILRALIDPNAAPVRTAPRRMRSLHRGWQWPCARLRGPETHHWLAIGIPPIQGRATLL